ncbi:MAG: glycosyltransferase [Chloroflexota bacterium]
MPKFLRRQSIRTRKCVYTIKITLIAPGSQGDVRPYIALGKGLQAAGHSIRIATNINFEILVKQHGLVFCPMHGDVVYSASYLVRQEAEPPFTRFGLAAAGMAAATCIRQRSPS